MHYILHILQPADVAVFKPLKDYWKQDAREWYLKNPERILTKIEFAIVFKLGYDREQIPCHVRSGFKKCGLYPYDPEAVDYTKCVQNTLERLETDSTQSNETNCLSLTDFESTIKVLNNLKSRVTHKIDDINWVLDEIKILKNNLPNTLVEGDTTIDDQPAVIEEYHVNDDGSLSVIVENQDNELNSTNNISEIGIDNLAEDFNEEDFLMVSDRQEPAVDGIESNTLMDLTNTTELIRNDSESQINMNDVLENIEIFPSIDPSCTKVITEPSDTVMEDLFGKHLKYPKPIEKF